MAEIERVIEGLESIKQLGASGSPAHIKIDEAIQTIRELQSKSDEVCEWKRYYSTREKCNDMYTTSHCDCREPNLRYGDLKWFNYCPYCGKKIKVVE